MDSEYFISTVVAVFYWLTVVCFMAYKLNGQI